MAEQTTRLRPGVAAIDRLMKANRLGSVARMDEAALRRLQETVIPDGGIAALFLGRLQRGVTVETRTFAGPHGPLPLRIYTPTPRTPATATATATPTATPTRPVVLNFHGGGFALGSARQCDWTCSVVARDLDAVVVSVDYRLAPTHRFPAAVEDCWAALGWTAAHAAELGADPERLVVMGDSAGGNLAAVVSIMAREQGGPRIRHQALVYPATDLSDAVRETPSYLSNTRGIVLSNDDLEIFHGHYVTEDADPLDWRLSPLHAADLSGLPPAVVVVAGLDPLHDSGVRYAEALVAAGGHARVEDFHQMPHGFLSFPYFSKGARPALRAVVAAQRSALEQDRLAG